MKAAAVQFESSAGNKAANFAVLESFAADAARQGVELIVFPECCLTGYWFIRHLMPAQLDALAEPVPDGPGTRRLAEMAVRLGLTIGAGLIESAGESYYNTYVLALPDGTIHRHRKLHAFEHDLISSGSEYSVFDLPGGLRAGVLICYDCNIVENVRATALAGADVLLAPHQTGGVRSRNPHLMGLVDREAWDSRHRDPARIDRELRGDKGRGWLMRWLPSRAHDNGMFLIFSNGIGVDDDEIRTGNAMILDPYGRILAETCAAGNAMIVADLDASLLADATGRGWMRARRPGLYVPLTVPTGREVDTRKVKFQE